MLKGYRTIAVGAAMAVLPSLLTYLAGVDWTHILGPNAAFILAGVITVAMRFVTDTPPGKSA